MTDWLERLAPGPLPVFAHTKKALLEQCRRSDEIGVREVAQVVLTDPLATLALIYSANQLGSRLGSEVTTAEGALMMLGISRYLDQARTLPALEASPAGARQLAALHTLLRRVHHGAWQARDFAVLHSDVHADEVQAAALLYAAPEFLLLLRAPAEAARIARLKRSMSAEDAEKQVLGDISLNQLRLPLLESWKIARHSRDLLDPTLAHQTRQTILRAGINIAERAQQGWWNDALLDDYLALSGIDQLSLEQVIATAHANAMYAEHAANWIAAPGPGVWMPMLPGPWPEEPDDAALPAARVSTETAPSTPPPSVRAAQSPAARPTAPKPAASPMPDKQVLREALQGIEGHLDGSLNLNQMSVIILKGLHHGLGLSRILFAMITPDGKGVKSRFTMGIPTEDPLRHFAFPLDARDLFGQLMGKMQGLWMNEGNRNKLWPMIHPDLQKMIGSADFYAMSLHANGKPVGLIYADRGHGETGLDALTYTDFKMLCLQAARGLGKIKA